MKEHLWWDEGCLGVRSPPHPTLIIEGGGYNQPLHPTFDDRWWCEGGSGYPPPSPPLCLQRGGGV